MEISSLSQFHMDNFRMSSSMAISGASENVALRDVATKSVASGNIQSFAEIFERTKSSPQTFAAPAVSDAASGSSNARSNKIDIDKNDKLYQLCLELETFLVKNLLNGMRKTVQKSGLIDNSFAGKMYEDMLYDEYAKDFTKNANFGLAEQAYLQLKQYGS